MSEKQKTPRELNDTSNINSLNKSKVLRVDINNLLYKVREEKSRERKESYIFLGLVIGVIAVTGAIASF
jgi:hypothetical protein|tara:strand:+ start:933 stop:1139 length:207 start_codon:yes stop_codon:yes gene_type:complete